MKPFEQFLLSFLANASEAFLLELAALVNHKLNPQATPTAASKELQQR